MASTARTSPARSTCAGHGLIDFAALQGALAVANAQPGILLTANGEAGAAEMEFAGDAAGDDATQRPHRPAGRQGWPGRIAQLRSERPAEMEIRRVQIQAETDEDTGMWTALFREAGGIESFGGDLQHEQLLRQCLLQFPRRNAETIGVYRDGRIEVVTGEGMGVESLIAEPVALSDTPHQCGGGDGDITLSPPRTRCW